MLDQQVITIAIGVVLSGLLGLLIRGQSSNGRKIENLGEKLGAYMGKNEREMGEVKTDVGHLKHEHNDLSGRVTRLERAS